MTIQFRCPSCRRSLKVRDAWAGKRAECPACKKVIAVPQASEKIDVEALAAAALSEQPAGPAVEQKPIDFPCPYCDEKITAAADLADKRTPCPHCGRIVKVPKPKPSGPIDWRQSSQRLPSAARRDTEPAPEGAWGTAAVSRVSAEALIEAKVVTEAPRRPRAPLSARTKVALGMICIVGATLLAVGVWQSILFRAHNKQERAFARVESVLGSGHSALMPDGSPATELYRAAGEYALRENRLSDAVRYFGLGRAQAAAARTQNADSPTKWLDHDVALVYLAATQSRLLGDLQQVTRHQRLDWNDTQTELYRTLQNIATPEGRADAMRVISRLILPRGPNLRVDALVNMLGHEKETPELLGIVGLEALRADERPLAEDIVKVVLTPYETTLAKSKGKAAPHMAPAVSLLALLISLNQQARAEKFIAPAPKPADMPPEEVRVGYALGWARVGKLSEARALAKGPGPAEAKLHALVAIAEAVADSDPKNAVSDITDARNLLTGELKGHPVSPLLLLRFAHIALVTGVIEKIDQFPDVLKQGDMTRQTMLTWAIYRLDHSTAPDTEALTRVMKESAFGPALEMLARLNARAGESSAVLTEADTWMPETLRPFGYAGVALGLQDNRK